MSTVNLLALRKAELCSNQQGFSSQTIEAIMLPRDVVARGLEPRSRTPFDFAQGDDISGRRKREVRHPDMFRFMNLPLFGFRLFAGFWRAEPPVSGILRGGTSGRGLEARSRTERIRDDNLCMGRPTMCDSSCRNQSARSSTNHAW
jgi:hypothetical protein